MLYVIHALDAEGALPARLATYDAHRSYLSQDHGAVSLVMSGPLVGDDGETMIGSFLLVEAPDRASAEAFNRGDPFFAAGIWRQVSVTAFLKRRG